MFDLLGDVVDLFTPTADPPGRHADEVPAASGPLLWGPGGDAEVTDDIAASLGVDVEALRADYDTDAYDDEYDMLGQEGREEDEARQVELDFTRDLMMIDDRDPVGAAGTFVEDDALVGFHSLAEMVDLALDTADGDPIGRLTIMDHAKPGSQQVGDDRLTAATLEDPEMLEALARLRGGFGRDGALDLQGCHVAAGEGGDALLRGLASTLDVPVTGGYQYQSPLFSGFEGATKTCFPPITAEDGSVSQSCTINQDPIGDALWNGFLQFYGRDVEDVE